LPGQQLHTDLETSNKRAPE